ncbi:OmpA family protein [Thalassiella azotivora]
MTVRRAAARRVAVTAGPLLVASVLVGAAGPAVASDSATTTPATPEVVGVPWQVDPGEAAGAEGAVHALGPEPQDLAPRVERVLGRIGTPDGALTSVAEGEEFVLAADVYFAFDSADLQPRAAEDLQRVVAQVRENGTTSLLVTGHTDSVGDDAYNDDLSLRRAQAVAAALTGALPEVAVSAEGRGEREPVVDESQAPDVDAARAANRRVEITAEG